MFQKKSRRTGAVCVECVSSYLCVVYTLVALCDVCVLPISFIPMFVDNSDKPHPMCKVVLQQYGKPANSIQM